MQLLFRYAKKYFFTAKGNGKNMWNEKRGKDIRSVDGRNGKENHDEADFDLPEQHGIACLPGYA
jgi:hypothetical protein